MCRPALVLSGLLILASADLVSDQPKAARPVEIRADELNDKYVVFGPLGLPFGKLATVEAEVIENRGKGEPQFLRVTSVNSRRLNTPVETSFRLTWPNNTRTLESGRTYKLRTYQSGEFDGVPNELNDEWVKDRIVPQSRGFWFYTHLEVVKAL